jgi:hypothetical protein
MNNEYIKKFKSPSHSSGDIHVAYSRNLVMHSGIFLYILLYAVCGQPKTPTLIQILNGLNERGE